jgi:hypothetical protein
VLNHFTRSELFEESAVWHLPLHKLDGITAPM